MRELALEKTRVRGERAEQIRDLRVDVVLCRLVGKTDAMARVLAGLLKPDGVIILYKSATVEAELEYAQPVLNRLHLRPREVRDFPLPPFARRPGGAGAGIGPGQTRRSAPTVRPYS